jgi:outer membrane protein OmpA-like peptidoglycan-associated protein
MIRLLGTLLPVALLSLVCTVSTLAHAGDAQDLGLVFKTTIQGKDAPAIVVNNSRDLKRLDITLTDAQGKSQSLRTAALSAGSRKPLPFKLGEGTTSFKARVDVVWGDGETDTFSLDFQATRLGKLDLVIGADDVDLDAMTLSARATNPATTLELVITGESGEMIWSGRETYDPPADPQTELAIRWEALPEKILSMQIKVTDVAGFWKAIKVTPFSVEIPHEELIFDSGSAHIRDDQVHKLEATWGEVDKALKKYGTQLELRLYIAGYTDTVGDKASNRALSNSRAAAIASWFRKRGLKTPIYYAGFGEDGLAKPTPDETEEQANRRAKYILSSHTPSGADLPRGDWKPL